MSIDGFLTRAEVDYLAEKLSHVPDLESEMAIALTGRSSARGNTGRRMKPGSRPPYPLHIEAMLDELKAELVGAVRHVIESRGIDYDGGDTLSGCSKWLIRYRFALSMMVDAGETFDGLCKVIDRARRTMQHEERMDFTEAHRKEANKKLMTAPGIEDLAKLIGEPGHGLNRQRISRLVNAGRLHPESGCVVLDKNGVPKDTRVYRLGDVLDAHAEAPKRKSYGQRV